MRGWLGCFVTGALLLPAAEACPQVMINEILSAPGSDWNSDGGFSAQDDEWVEIHNAGAAAVDLSDYLIGDELGIRMGFSESIGPGGYVFVTGEMSADWEAASGLSSVGLSLNNSGDVVRLLHVTGTDTTEVDRREYVAGEVTSSIL